MKTVKLEFTEQELVYIKAALGYIVGPNECYHELSDRIESKLTYEAMRKVERIWLGAKTKVDKYGDVSIVWEENV